MCVLYSILYFLFSYVIWLYHIISYHIISHHITLYYMYANVDIGSTRKYVPGTRCVKNVIFRLKPAQ